MTVAYVMQTDPLDDEALFRECYGAQSPWRQQKIDRLIFPKDKKLSLAAGLLFQAGLGDYGLRKQPLTIVTNDNGKPFILEHPELFFNISHAGTLVICAFSRREIGVDVEKVRAIDLAIARQFFCAAECRDIMTAAHPVDTFFDYWVLKESYMKALGLGFRLPLAAFRMALAETIRVYVDDIVQPCAFYRTTIFENYKLAICVQGELPDVELRVLSVADAVAAA